MGQMEGFVISIRVLRPAVYSVEKLCAVVFRKGGIGYSSSKKIV